MNRNYPSVWRVCMVALFIALVANVFLAWITSEDDWFATIIGIASGVAAVGLVIARYVVPRFVGEVLLLSTAIWVANLIEFISEDGPRWESQFRQGGFYAAFAIISIGCYVATRET